MNSQKMPKVEPRVLQWARETAGLSLEAAAEKLSLNAAYGMTGGDRLSALEAGDGAPSRPLLLKMADVYRRPLITFYLPAPPEVGERGQDFRTLPAEYSRQDEALVDALIRDVKARQEMVKALMLEEDDAQPLPYVGSRRREEGVAAVLSAIKTTLEINTPAFRGSRGGFAYLRDRAEQAGIFVLLMGNLGSHHTNIDTELFRGFALADKIAPFVVINDQDHEAAWAFTLLHELTHIWLGQTGVSGANGETALERFCDTLASEFLLPEQRLLDAPIAPGATIGEIASAISRVAATTGASHTSIAYKLLQQGKIDWATWRSLQQLYRRSWLAAKATEKAKRDGNGGPSYYVVRRHRLGKRLLDFAGRMVSGGALVPTKAAEVLGVKPSNVPRLLSDGRGSEVAG